MEHAGKHALVTGGGSGIGAGIALGLARAGAHAAITGRSASKPAVLADTQPNLYPIVMDVEDEASVVVGIQCQRPYSDMRRKCWNCRRRPFWYHNLGRLAPHNDDKF